MVRPDMDRRSEQTQPPLDEVVEAIKELVDGNTSSISNNQLREILQSVLSQIEGKNSTTVSQEDIDDLKAIKTRLRDLKNSLSESKPETTDSGLIIVSSQQKNAAREREKSQLAMQIPTVVNTISNAIGAMERLLVEKPKVQAPEGFNPRAFEDELSQRNAFKEIFDLRLKATSNFEVNNIQLRPEYPQGGGTLQNKVDQINTDLQILNRLLQQLNQYETIDVLGEMDIEKKREVIKASIQPKWEQLRDKLQQRKLDLELENWKAEISSNPAYNAVTRLVEQISAQIDFPDRESAQKELDKITAVIIGLRRLISVDQKKFVGREEDVEQFIVETYIQPLEAQASELENKVYEKWQAEVNDELQETNRLVNEIPKSLGEFTSVFVKLGNERNRVNTLRQQKISQLPNSQKKFGEDYLENLLLLAQNRLEELIVEQFNFLVTERFGETSSERINLNDAINKANANLDNDNVDILRNYETSLVEKINNFSMAVRSEKTNLIKENAELIENWIGGQTLSANEVLNSLRNNILRDSESRKQRVFEKIEAIRSLNLNTEDDYRAVNIQQLTDMKNEMLEELNTAGLDASEVPNYELALDRINKFIEERKRPKYLNWDEIVAEMLRLNMDPWDHSKYEAGGTASQYEKELYLIWIGKRNKPKEERESPEARLKRVESKTLIQLVVLDNEMQAENERACSVRDILFDKLKEKDVFRDELLEATTCHPVYGMDIRAMLFFIIEHGAESTANYNAIVNESQGRGYVLRTLKDEFGEILKAKYPGEDGKESETYKRIFDLVPLLYNVFNLVDTSFAELQSRTATQLHSRGAKGEPGIDVVMIDRSDAAAVHRSQRYDKEADWSQWDLIYYPEPQFIGQSDNPDKPTINDRGADRESNHKLRAIRHKLLLHQKAHFTTTGFEGKIPPSTLFNPLFPDTIQFLLPAEACPYINKGWPEVLVIGEGEDRVVYGHEGKYINIGGKAYIEPQSPDEAPQPVLRYGSHEVMDFPEETMMTSRSEYPKAEEAWMQLKEKNFRPITHGIPAGLIHKNADGGVIMTGKIILENDGSDTGGLIDTWISLAGIAKIYPGHHLEYAIEPYLTHYIQRMVTMCPATDKARMQLYHKIEEKLLSASRDSKGLGAYRDQIMRVIENLKRDNWKALDYVNDGKRDERIAYVNEIWHEKGRTIPSGVGRLITTDPYAKEYWRIVNKEEGLPETGVNRNGDFKEKK